MPDPAERRLRRCYHRVISGLEKGGQLRLITLTSSNQAVNPIGQDFRRLIMRLRRRGLLQDYIKVVEEADDLREHVHLCFRGSYIAQAWLSALWEIIHQSPIVDVRRVKTGKRHKRNVAHYLAKYMAKAVFHRYSWSWGWVYKGFVKVWLQALRHFRAYSRLRGEPVNFYRFLMVWRAHLRGRSPPARLLGFLEAQVQYAEGVRKYHPYQDE